MKRLTVLIAALIFAMGTMARPPEAEARRGHGGAIAGIVAAAVIGGIIASHIRKKRKRHYAYYPRPTYYGPAYAYAQPSYVYRAAPVYRPVYRSRPVYYQRPIAYRAAPVFRGGFGGPRRAFRGGGRRWR